MTTKSSTSKKTIDAHIIEKTTSTPVIDDVEEQKFKPPPLPQTNNPFVLLGLSPSANFDAVKRAYKNLVKLYHPDVAVGPDATSDERKQASWDFARINAAYDILKRRENEDVFEYEIYVDGKQETRKVSLDKDQRRKDAHYIDYDRIREVAEYRRRYPKKKMWYEEEHEYQPKTNGFETNESFCSNEKWWNHLETFEYETQVDFPGYDGSFVSTQETIRREGFGFGAPYYERRAEEPFWHNRHTFTKHVDDGRWWHDGWHDDTTIRPHNDRWYNAAFEYDFGMRNGHDVEYFEPIQYNYNPNETWYRAQYDDTEPQCNGDFGP